MSDPGNYASLLSDLNLNPALFPHGTIEKFIDGVLRDYQMNPASIRPLLLSKSMVQATHAGESFRIAVSGAIEKERGSDANLQSRSIELLATVNSLHEAIGIAADLRKYYLRHFPGRCQPNTGESNFDSMTPSVAHVYIAFFDPK